MVATTHQAAPNAPSPVATKVSFRTVVAAVYAAATPLAAGKVLGAIITRICRGLSTGYVDTPKSARASAHRSDFDRIRQCWDGSVYKDIRSRQGAWL